MDDFIFINRNFVLDAINIGLSGYITDDDRLTLEGMGIAVSELPSVQPEAKELQDVKVERDYWKQRVKYAERME